MSGFVAPRCRVNVWAVVVEPPVVLVGPTVVVNFQLTTANLTHRTNPETEAQLTISQEALDYFGFPVPI